MPDLSSILIASFASLAAAGLVAPWILKLLIAAKSKQIINQHRPEHAAKAGTPTMGGFITLVGLLAGMAATWRPEFLGPLLMILLFGAVGFLDDYLMPRWKPGSRGLDWKPKLALEFAAVILACVLGGVLDPVTIVLAVIVVNFFSNAYNFSDGLDGLAGGIGILMSAGLLALMGLSGVGGSLGPILAALALGFVPFLFYNAAPARVFMGDLGALPFGAILGWVIFEMGRASGLQMWLALGVLSLLMVLELVPVPLQVASAKLRKGKRLFPFQTPIHHGFQHAGWPETRVTAMFHLFQGVCVLGAVALYHFGVGR